jgi:hypothetical protein
MEIHVKDLFKIATNPAHLRHPLTPINGENAEISKRERAKGVALFALSCLILVLPIFYLVSAGKKITAMPSDHAQAEKITDVFNEISKSSVEDSSEVSSSEVTSEQPSSVQSTTFEIPQSTVKLSAVLKAYLPIYAPDKNKNNLLEYVNSEDYRRHAQTARVYYNATQLAEEDALRVVFQREPTNIAMGRSQYNEEKLFSLFGYRKGVYNDPEAQKLDGTSFKELPNSAIVYSETFMWSPPAGNSKKEIACLSVPAPALDRTMQPHYNYYMQKGRLNLQRYEQEMQFLFAAIERALRDNVDQAFDGKGIKRVVLSRFGQGAFLGALTANEKQKAYNVYKNQMAKFIDRVKDLNVEIAMSEYVDPGSNIWLENMIIGDIVDTVQEGDLVVNAWDPHSAPGNGNDGDRSFDGAMGRGSGILATQTSWLNPTLKSKEALRAIE